MKYHQQDNLHLLSKNSQLRKKPTRGQDQNSLAYKLTRQVHGVHQETLEDLLTICSLNTLWKTLGNEDDDSKAKPFACSETIWEDLPFITIKSRQLFLKFYNINNIHPQLKKLWNYFVQVTSQWASQRADEAKQMNLVVKRTEIFESQFSNCINKKIAIKINNI